MLASSMMMTGVRPSALAAATNSSTNWLGFLDTHCCRDCCSSCCSHLQALVAFPRFCLAQHRKELSHNRKRIPSVSKPLEASPRPVFYANPLMRDTVEAYIRSLRGQIPSVSRPFEAFRGLSEAGVLHKSP